MICSVDWCDRPARGRGLCKPHHLRLMTGVPLDEPWGTRVGKGGGRTPTDPMIRIIARLDRDLPDRTPTECWPWPGNRTLAGYGQISSGTRPGTGAGIPHYVHRIMMGSPPGLEIMHKCDNPPCCNPAHLKAGTHEDNMRDMSNKGRASNQYIAKRNDAVAA